MINQTWSSAELSQMNRHSTFPMFHRRLCWWIAHYAAFPVSPPFFHSHHTTVYTHTHTICFSLPCCVQQVTGPLERWCTVGGCLMGVEGGETRHSEQHAEGDNNSSSGRTADAPTRGTLSLCQHKLGNYKTTHVPLICFHSSFWSFLCLLEGNLTLFCCCDWQYFSTNWRDWFMKWQNTHKNKEN